jgi:hypothetical protein
MGDAQDGTDDDQSNVVLRQLRAIRDEQSATRADFSARFNGIDARFTRLELDFKGMLQVVISLAASLRVLTESVDHHGTRLDTLEHK